MHDIEADAGEADVKCNWHAKCDDKTCSEFTIYQNADKKYIRWTFPEKAVANGEDAKVTADAEGDEENKPLATISLSITSEMKLNDWWAATVDISTGSFKADDVADLKPADDGADQTAGEADAGETTETET